MANVYTYAIDDNLYVNLTNKCTNDCTFCVRNEKTTYEGYALWLEHEPTAEQIVAQIGDPTRYREIVFCGFGEPTLRLDALLEIAEYVKRKGGVTRLNTNGHGNLIHKRNIAPDLAGKIDKINVSLNEASAEGDAALCKPAYGERAFTALQEFAKHCKAEKIDVWFSVVDCVGAEKIERCREIAADCGVPLRVREYIA